MSILGKRLASHGECLADDKCSFQNTSFAALSDRTEKVGRNLREVVCFSLTDSNLPDLDPDCARHVHWS